MSACGWVDARSGASATSARRGGGGRGRGSSAAVTVRPTTSEVGPAAMASAGVATRPWSSAALSAGADAGRDAEQVGRDAADRRRCRRPRTRRRRNPAPTARPARSARSVGRRVVVGGEHGDRRAPPARAGPRPSAPGVEPFDAGARASPRRRRRGGSGSARRARRRRTAARRDGRRDVVQLEVDEHRRCRGRSWRRRRRARRRCTARARPWRRRSAARTALASRTATTRSSTSRAMARRSRPVGVRSHALLRQVGDGGDVVVVAPSAPARPARASRPGGRRRSPCRRRRRTRRRAAARPRRRRSTTPPTPTMGRSGRAACTSCTARTATGWMRRPRQPAAAGTAAEPVAPASSTSMAMPSSVLTQRDRGGAGVGDGVGRPRRSTRVAAVSFAHTGRPGPTASTHSATTAARRRSRLGEQVPAAVEVRARQVDLDGDDGVGARPGARRPCA